MYTSLSEDNDSLNKRVGELQNQVVVHAGLYDQLLNEHAALRAENKALNEVIDNARHDSWGQAGVIEKLEARVAELRGLLKELRIRLHFTGRRPEECYEMSLIDAALAKEGE